MQTAPWRSRCGRARRPSSGPTRRLEAARAGRRASRACRTACALASRCSTARTLPWSRRHCGWSCCCPSSASRSSASTAGEPPSSCILSSSSCACAWTCETAWTGSCSTSRSRTCSWTSTARRERDIPLDAPAASRGQHGRARQPGRRLELDAASPAGRGGQAGHLLAGAAPPRATRRAGGAGADGRRLRLRVRQRLPARHRPGVRRRPELGGRGRRGQGPARRGHVAARRIVGRAGPAAGAAGGRGAGLGRAGPPVVQGAAGGARVHVEWVRVLLTTFTFSKSLSLKGSCIHLEPKSVVGVRGSALDFATSVADEYLGDVLESLGPLLGRSSLLNVPRGTLKMGGKIVQGVACVSDRAAQLADWATLDDEYVERQARARRRRQIGSVQQGVAEAVGDLGEGLGGMLDVVRRPVRGAREGGVGGFVAGVGKGLVSSVVKPIGAVGRAVAHICAGVAAQVGSAAEGAHREVVRVRRPPRLLAGPLGAVVEYSELEAHVASKLPGIRIEVVVPLCYSTKALRSGAEGPRPLLQTLVLATDAVFHVEMHEPEFVAKAEVSNHAAELDADLAMLVGLKADAGLQHKPLPEDEQLEAALSDPQLARGTFSDVADALLEALTSASAASNCTRAAAVPPSGDDWTERLRRAMSLARSSATAQGGAPSWADSGQLCAVLEVERRAVAGGWRVPYLKTDAEQRHRWMDAGLQRKHPLLDPQQDWQTAREPPIVMSSIWQPVGGWRLVTDERTDAEGWRYGPGWSSGSWRPSPRPVLDSVRQRRWERQYRICDVESAAQAAPVDSTWLRGIGLSTAPTLCRRMSRCCCCCCQAVAGQLSGRTRRVNR
ncbi:unnamed protein product, partial [Prorocentrum cordatum]